MNSDGLLTLTTLGYNPSFQVGKVSDRRPLVINSDAVIARSRTLHRRTTT